MKLDYVSKITLHKHIMSCIMHTPPAPHYTTSVPAKRLILTLSGSEESLRPSPLADYRYRQKSCFPPGGKNMGRRRKSRHQRKPRRSVEVADWSACRFIREGGGGDRVTAGGGRGSQSRLVTGRRYLQLMGPASADTMSNVLVQRAASAPPRSGTKTSRNNESAIASDGNCFTMTMSCCIHARPAPVDP